MGGLGAQSIEDQALTWYIAVKNALGHIQISF